MWYLHVKYVNLVMVWGCLGVAVCVVCVVWISVAICGHMWPKCGQNVAKMWPRCAVLLSLPVQMSVWWQVWLLPRIQPLGADMLLKTNAGNRWCRKPHGIVMDCSTIFRSIFNHVQSWLNGDSMVTQSCSIIEFNHVNHVNHVCSLAGFWCCPTVAFRSMSRGHRNHETLRRFSRSSKIQLWGLDCDNF